MNSKTAKKLRKKADGFILQYIKERILDESLTKGMDDGTIMGVLPERILYRKGFTVFNGVFTKRWFKLTVKKHPDWNYNQVIESATK